MKFTPCARCHKLVYVTVVRYLGAEIALDAATTCYTLLDGGDVSATPMAMAEHCCDAERTATPPRRKTVPVGEQADGRRPEACFRTM